MKLKSPNGKAVIDCHPGNIKSMKAAGWKPVKQSSTTKPAKQAQEKPESESNGENQG